MHGFNFDCCVGEFSSIKISDVNEKPICSDNDKSRVISYDTSIVQRHFSAESVKFIAHVTSYKIDLLIYRVMASLYSGKQLH